jgi:hypothetical protein
LKEGREEGGKGGRREEPYRSERKKTVHFQVVVSTENPKEYTKIKQPTKNLTELIT